MMTIQQLAEKIRECYFYSVDEDNNLLEVVDSPKLFDIHLTLIVDLMERIEVLERERNALIQIRQRKRVQKEHKDRD